MPRGTFALTVLLLGSFIAFAAPPSRGAGMLAADGTGGLLEIQEHHVAVTINNGIAVTKVTQVFFNPEDRIVDGVYSFPVPARASVAGFSLWVGGREMIGEVAEKQAAREIYYLSKAQGHQAGVLEQSDYRAFNLRTGPIAPHAQQKVQVTYYQELDSDGEWTTYVYPLASNTQQGVNSRVSKAFDMTVDAKSADAILEMHSPSHARSATIKRFSDTYASATIAAQGAALDRDVVVTWRSNPAPTHAGLAAYREGDAEGYFCLMLNADEPAAPANAAADYIFLLDISGSMRDDDKLDQSRGTLASLLEMLAPEDQFNVLAFNTQPTAALGALVPADDAGRAKAGAFLNSQRAHGGTDFNTALAAAYKYARGGRALNIVLISDGLSEQSSLPMLTRMIGRRPLGSRILCVGVGNDVDRALLQRMADATGGLAAFISADDDFHRQAAALRRKLRRPVITDAVVQIDGAGAHELEAGASRRGGSSASLPRGSIAVGNLYAGVPGRIYGRYATPGPAQITLTGKLAGADFSRTFAVDFPADAQADPEIQRMWAWRRVDRLLNSPRGNAGDIDQIIALGEKYSIATEYTSFIVLENDAEYGRWKIAQKNARRLEQDRDAQAQLSSQLEILRRRAPDGLGVAKPARPAAELPGIKTPAVAAARAVSFNAPAEPSPHYQGGGAVDPLTAALAGMLAVSGIIMRTRKARQNTIFNQSSVDPHCRNQRD